MGLRGALGASRSTPLYIWRAPAGPHRLASRCAAGESVRRVLVSGKDWAFGSDVYIRFDRLAGAHGLRRGTVRRRMGWARPAGFDGRLGASIHMFYYARFSMHL